MTETGRTSWWCKHCARPLEHNGNGKRADTVTASPAPKPGSPAVGALSITHDSCGGVASLTKDCKRSVTEG